MEKVSTSQRLKEYMSINGLKQKDILDAIKPFCKKYNVRLEKNDLSQYVSGKVEPGQKKISLLSMALNVNPVWLLGYDVPMNDKDKDTLLKEKINSLSEKQKDALITFIDNMK